MKRKLAVLGTALMAAAAITACGGRDAGTAAPAAAETGTTVKEAETTVKEAGTTAKETGETEAAGDTDGTAEAMPLLEAESGEGAVSAGAGEAGTDPSLKPAVSDDVSHAGAELEKSEIKPFAQKIQKAVADKDMAAMADLCGYPVYVSLGENHGEEINDKAAFMKLDADKFFTDALLKEIADTDVDTLEQFGAGVIMGEENVIIYNRVNGQPGISGINLK